MVFAFLVFLIAVDIAVLCLFLVNGVSAL